MNKKSIGALLLSAALLVGATGSTFAYFTDTQKTDIQSITLGNLHVTWQPTSGDDYWKVIGRSVPNFQEAKKVDPKSERDLKKDDGYDELAWANKNSISNIAPGDLLYKTFTLQNTGKLDAKIKLSIADAQVVGVDNTANLLGGNYLVKAYTLGVDGKPGDDVLIIADADNPGSFVLDAKTNEKIVVCVYVYFDSSINNTGENKNLKFDVQVDATQWNNPGWNQ